MIKDYKASKNGDSKDRGEFSEAFPQEDASGSKIDSVSFDAISDAKSSISIPSRNAVLQACIITSALMLALGAFIRQVIIYQSFLLFLFEYSARKIIIVANLKVKSNSFHF